MILQLMRIDGQHFLEIMSNSVVFVNDVRVQFKMLGDGARITLGGVAKSYQQGARFPAGYVARPHLVYEYHAIKEQPITGVYRDPVFTADELITVEEFVGGRYVKDVYHSEDFNITLVLIVSFTRCLNKLL